MKLRKFIFILLILASTFQNALSQEKTNSILIDQFELLPYDYLRGRLDQFVMELVNNPNLIGYIIVYGQKSPPLIKYHYEILLKEHLAYRNFPKERIVFLHGKDEEQIRVQLWKTPRGADPPHYQSGDWSYKLPPAIKPFVVHKNSWIVEDGFETFSLEFYSKFLKANPYLRGNLVIHEKSAEAFHRTKRKLVGDLAGKNNVPQNQLRFFHVKGKKRDVEFWLVHKIR